MTSQLRTALRLGIVASIGFSQACTADGTRGVDGLGQAELALDGASCTGPDYADGCLCDLAHQHTVPLYRVASRANGACLGHSVNPRYPEFEAAGVSNENQRDLYIAGITDPPPPKAQTQIMILTAAGQRPPASSGVWNRMTGQRAGYRDLFDCDQQFSWYNLHGDGLAWKLWQNPTEWRHWAGPMNVQAIFDTTSAFQTPGDEKGDLRAAYTAYVKNHIAPSGKLIYLAGSSRGACVMAGVAKNLKADPAYVNTPMVLHLVDPVCAENDDWSFNGWYDNPLNDGSYKAKGLDLSAAFSDQAKKSLSIYSIVTGDKVVLDSARAFVDVNTPAGATTHSLSWSANGFTKTWYEQKWIDVPHEFLGRTCGEKWSIDTQLQTRYSSELARFWCAGSASFNPETQSCCPAGQYWSAATNACLPEPVCSSTGYLQPNSDPKLCVECLEREMTIPSGLGKPIPQYELNDAKNGCERVCPACTDFAGKYVAKEVCTKEGLCKWVKEPVCVARQCGVNQVCSASASPAGQCVCDASAGFVFDAVSSSCIENPCVDEYHVYDGKRCVDQCSKRPGSTPLHPLHFDCRSGTCVGSGVISPAYNPRTGECGSFSTPK